VQLDDRRNTDDLQVTQQVMAVCKSSANAQQLHTVQAACPAAADSTVCHSSMFRPPQTTTRDE